MTKKVGVGLLITGVIIITAGICLSFTNNGSKKELVNFNDTVKIMNNLNNYTVNSTINITSGKKNNKYKVISQLYYLNQLDKVQSYIVENEVGSINDYGNNKYYSKMEDGYKVIEMSTTPDIKVLYNLLGQIKDKGKKLGNGTYQFKVLKKTIETEILKGDNFYGVSLPLMDIKSVEADGKLLLNLSNSEVESIILTYKAKNDMNVEISTVISNINITKDISLPVIS
ncbi:MAG: hypothetical protein RR047_01940 [Bacilli bacterium]